jgi:hypothetical protein
MVHLKNFVIIDINDIHYDVFTRNMHGEYYVETSLSAYDMVRCSDHGEIFFYIQAVNISTGSIMKRNW